MFHCDNLPHIIWQHSLLLKSVCIQWIVSFHRQEFFFFFFCTQTFKVFTQKLWMNESYLEKGSGLISSLICADHIFIWLFQMKSKPTFISAYTDAYIVCDIYIIHVIKVTFLLKNDLFSRILMRASSVYSVRDHIWLWCYCRFCV